jgi:hypothetical protein
LSDILVLLVVNFQDSFGTNKAESAHASSFQRCLFVFKQSIAKEHSDCGEEESATECPDPDSEGTSSAANLPPASDPVSMTRTFCGALFFPTVAVFLGNALFENEKAPLKRACMGGFCFVGAKGVLKIYHKQHQYIRQSKRLILDYDQ